MGSFLVFLAITAVIILACRALASAFPVIKTIAAALIWIIPIVVWCTNGFWMGLLALFGAAIVLGILFGFDFDGDARNYKKSSYRPKSGIKCENCGSTNTYKLNDEERGELCNLQYRANNYTGTMKDAYKCQDCGYHVWFDHDGKIFYTSPKE